MSAAPFAYFGGKTRLADRIITPGAAYLEHKSFPGSDDGWGDAAGHPVRMAECSTCATRYGRTDLLDDPR